MHKVRGHMGAVGNYGFVLFVRGFALVIAAQDRRKKLCSTHFTEVETALTATAWTFHVASWIMDSAGNFFGTLPELPAANRFHAAAFKKYESILSTITNRDEKSTKKVGCLTFLLQRDRSDSAKTWRSG